MSFTQPRPRGGPPPFIIYALPRSRTAWLAELLTYGDVTCHHEMALRMRTPGDVREFLARPNTGTAETAAAPGWRLIDHYVPGIPKVVIRRNRDDVLAAMLALARKDGFAYNERPLARLLVYLDRLLDEIERQDNTLTVDFADLDDEGACRGIFEHCLPYRFDRPWWLWYRDRNIQADVKGMMQFYADHRAALERFKLLCWGEMRVLRRAGLIRKAA